MPALRRVLEASLTAAFREHSGLGSTAPMAMVAAADVDPGGDLVCGGGGRRGAGCSCW